MAIPPTFMEAYHCKDTYSHKTRSKREPKRMMRALVYHKKPGPHNGQGSGIFIVPAQNNE